MLYKYEIVCQRLNSQFFKKQFAPISVSFWSVHFKNWRSLLLCFINPLVFLILLLTFWSYMLLLFSAWSVLWPLLFKMIFPEYSYMKMLNLFTSVSFMHLFLDRVRSVFITFYQWRLTIHIWRRVSRTLWLHSQCIDINYYLYIV